MKDRLKKKLKAKKILSNKGENLKAPKPKTITKIYEMPPEYQVNLQKLADMIDKRDSYIKQISMLPPVARREAQTVLFNLNDNIESFEQSLADEFRDYQEEQLFWEVAALTDLEEGMSEEHFIRVKHLQPELFEEFERRVIEGMTDAERREQNLIIARREAEELDEIISGRRNAAPYESIFIKHRLPDHWMPELLLDVINGAYETDDFFQINYEALDRITWIISHFNFEVNDALPVRRRNMEEAIFDLRRQHIAGANFLLEYVEKCLANGDFLAKEKVYAAGIEEDFACLARCRQWKYVILKHTEPENLEEYTRIVTEDFTREETEAFMKSVAECDEKDANTLLQSIEYERLNRERVQTYRANRTQKISGAQLSERERQNIKESQRMKEKNLIKKETESEETIQYDLPKRFFQFLRAFRAVTGERIAPERYEDEQSREDEKTAQVLAEMSLNMEKLFIIIKHQFPEKFEEFEKTLEPLSSGQKQKFYARIDYLEATSLNEILDNKD